jgi:predicted Zn-dependent protease
MRLLMNASAHFRWQLFSSALFFLLFFLLVAHRAGAHADLEIQISNVTQQIQLEPKSAGLLLQRGELHRLHGDWTNALTDYTAAQKLDPKLVVVHRARGQMLYEAERPEEALADLNRFLGAEPKDARGLYIRGYIFLRLGRPAEAAADFNRSIAENPAPGIGDYLARAQALAACGTNQIQEALDGLDQGSRRFGASFLLQNLAIDLEIARGHWDGALQRLEAAADRLPRKEAAFARRGEILEKAGRPRAAADAYREALRCIETLPAARRNVTAVQTLESTARAAVTRLASEEEDTVP